MPDTLVYTSGLHNTAVLCDITEKYGKTTIFGIGMLQVTDTTVGTVRI